jgi:hypothetical protein
MRRLWMRKERAWGSRPPFLLDIFVGRVVFVNPPFLIFVTRIKSCTRFDQSNVYGVVIPNDFLWSLENDLQKEFHSTTQASEGTSDEWWWSQSRRLRTQVNRCKQDKLIDHQQ